jgi:KDO2-lipid IV(A) lauroyltransferase
VAGYRKKVVYDNLHNSFPDKSDKEIDTIARDFYHFFADLLVESIKIMHLSGKEISRRVKYVDAPLFEELYKKGKHALVVMGHYGNWEWLPGIPLQVPNRTMSVYKPLNNKLFDNLVKKMRTKFGSDLIPMRSVPKVLLQYLNENTPSTSLFIADQSPMRSEIQYWTTFLNQDTPIYTGVEKLAKKYNMAVMFLVIRRVKRGYYNVHTKMLFEDVSNAESHEITEAHVKALEQEIIAAPQYWLWTHRRWKHKRETN